MSKISLPQPARRLAWYGASYGFGVFLAMAPLLGAKRIPVFRPLLDLFPAERETVLLSISAFLLGLVAVSVHFFLVDKVADARIRRWFLSTLAVAVAGTFVLMYLHDSLIVNTPSFKEPVIIGWSRLPTCGCPTGQNDSDCIVDWGGDLDKCWSPRQRKHAMQVLQLNYFCVLGAFEILVGLLVLREHIHAERRRRARQRKASGASVKPPRKPRKAKSPSTTSAEPAASDLSATTPPVK